MEWYLAVLKKYAEFDGRARRQEYWMFALFNAIFGVIAIFIDETLGTAGLVYGLYFLAIFIPSLAVSVRRLHDVGKSGWMLFIAIVPIIGAIWLFILSVTDSKSGANQYGDNPKETSTI